MSDLAPGRVLGDRFEIVGVLGRGGTSSVWLAHDRVRGERVALKVLHEHLASQPSMRRRLRREVLAAGRLRHPSALVAFDLHELDGRLALAMPLHPGRTLQHQVQADGPLDADVLDRLARDLLGALAEAHRHGIVHRDVTPANVLVDAAGTGVLTDFGLAAVGEVRSATGTAALGTSGYAAPEVWEGECADPRIDLYGLGATLYFAATGRGPYDAPNPVGTLQRQIAEDRVPLATARPDLPPWLVACVEACLAKDPGRRPSGALEALDLLASRRPPVRVAPIATRGERAPPQRVGLPPGPYRVWIRESSNQRDRRSAARRRARRSRSDLGATVEELADRANQGLRGWLGLPIGRAPEEALADAVAHAAGLPAGALEVSPLLFEKRFLLVNGVSGRTADALVRRARAAGFRADATQSAEEEWAANRADRARRIFTVVLMMLLVQAVFLGGLSLAGDHFPVIGVPFVAFFAFSVVRKTKAEGRLPPIAYPDVVSALRADLTDLYVEASPETLDPISAAPQPAPKAEEAPRPPGLAAGVLADLDALDRAIASAELPDAALRDLRATTADLRQRARELASAVEQRDEAVRRTDPGLATTVQRLEDRRERLLTLERAGDLPDRGELVRLESTLAHHQAEADARASEEQVLARQLGELLEIGATASRTRRELLDQGDPLRSAERLRGRLDAEVRAARSAVGETRSRRRQSE